MEYLHHATFGISVLGVLAIMFGVLCAVVRFLRSEVASARGANVEGERRKLRQVLGYLLGLIHAGLVVITYHAGGDTNPILSIFKGSAPTGSIASVPFQPFGFFALVILLLMAATSHDFWLANLSAPVWKSLHMLVYVAYGLLVLHVMFGVLQAEVNPIYAVAVGAGLLVTLGLHATAAFKEAPTDREISGSSRREEAHSEIRNPKSEIVRAS